jgi:hypothetical protein
MFVWKFFRRLGNVLGTAVDRLIRTGAFAAPAD